LHASNFAAPYLPIQATIRQLIISEIAVMNRSDLELTVAVRDRGSLAAAALHLGIAASVATKRLAALEAKIGQRLFQRTTRRVSVTTEGETFCLRAVGLLQGFAALEAELQESQSEPSGLIRLASTFGFGRLWLGPALANFQARYPRTQIQLQLTEQLPDLVAERFDGAVWLWAATGGRTMPWVSRRLGRNQRVLVASPDYINRHGTPTGPEDLKQHACLVVRENGGENNRSGGGGFDTWQLQKDRDKSTVRVQVHGPLSSNSGELVRDWCLNGRGIMLRSLWDIAPQLAAGDLVRVLPGYCMPDADIHWLAPYRPDAPRRIRLLIDFLVEQFAEEPWKKTLPPNRPAGVKPQIASPAARRGSRPAR
jgi:LysR family transcriptional regulator, transcriptional activator for dmlA